VSTIASGWDLEELVEGWRDVLGEGWPKVAKEARPCEGVEVGVSDIGLELLIVTN
jgi:hypothetical protein